MCQSEWVKISFDVGGDSYFVLPTFLLMEILKRDQILSVVIFILRPTHTSSSWHRFTFLLQCRFSHLSLFFESSLNSHRIISEFHGGKTSVLISKAYRTPVETKQDAWESPSWKGLWPELKPKIKCLFLRWYCQNAQYNKVMKSIWSKNKKCICIFIWNIDNARENKKGIERNVDSIQ